MKDSTYLTSDDLAKFEALRDASQPPKDTDHNAECACEACDEVCRLGLEARDALDEIRALDAVGRLLAEVRRLRARDAAWQRATRVDDPARVGERSVRLCSCNGADLPQIGDEIDACETCDGLVKAPVDEGAAAPPPPASRAQWVSRAARRQPATDARPSREPCDAGGGP